jgi:hypothetical protein
MNTIIFTTQGIAGSGNTNVTLEAGDLISFDSHEFKVKQVNAPDNTGQLVVVLEPKHGTTEPAGQPSFHNDPQVAGRIANMKLRSHGGALNTL